MRLSSTDMLNFVQTDNPPPAQAGLSVSTKKHDVPEELLSGLLANYKKPEDLVGENGLLKQLTKLLVAEKALDAELTGHLATNATKRFPTPAATRATARARKPSRAISVNCPSRCSATAMATAWRL